MKKISNIIKTLATTLFLMANPYLYGMERFNDNDRAMKSILCSMDHEDYYALRDEAIRLVHVGADTAIVPDCSLLKRATQQNDLEVVKILLANQANPYNKAYKHDDPDFFSIRTVEMAQAYAMHGVNLNTPGNDDHPNILYSTVLHRPLSSLIKFYIDNKVNTNTLRNYDGNCILHHLINCPWTATDIDDYVNIGKLLLNANPQLINIRNSSKQTPIDYAQKMIQQITLFNKEYKIREKLLTLFKQYASSINHQLSITATQHNQTNRFLTLPNELLTHILSQSIDTSKPLNVSGPLALLLGTVCKRFNAIELIPMLGKSCQCYSSKEKDAAMYQLLHSINDLTYSNKRRAVLLLILADANNAADKNYSLLRRAIRHNDTKMTDALLNNKVNPCHKCHERYIPYFFYLTTTEMAQLFLKHGVNLNTTGSFDYPNILYITIMHYPSSQLVQLYLENKVNTKVIRGSNGNCILHHLVACAGNAKNGIDDYVQIGKLLLHANPDLINKFNKYGETPLDYAQKELTQYPYQWYIDSNEYKIYEKFIALFEQHGGKTALQLKQLENNDNNKQHDCIICFETYDKMFNIPCPNGHPDRICKQCLQTLSNCPLCNTLLKK